MGRRNWDKIGRSSMKSPAEQPALSLIAWQKAQKELGDGAQVPAEIKEIIKKERKRSG